MHAFRGAGIVLRCPHCDNALVKIVESGRRMWMDFGGMQTLEITLEATPVGAREAHAGNARSHGILDHSFQGHAAAWHDR